MLVPKTEAASLDLCDAQRNTEPRNLPMASYFHWAPPPSALNRKDNGSTACVPDVNCGVYIALFRQPTITFFYSTAV
jgi:hypothetical protein